MPVVWSAFVNRNELAWKDDALSFEVPVNTSESMTATIVNKSGTQHYLRKSKCSSHDET
jgi:hypothetical protein